MDPHFEKLPSGKTILRRYADDGSIIEEHHSYGLLDIGIQISFTAAAKTSETYFLKRRMVGRRAYEKARAAYPDMPVADTAVEDFSGSLMPLVRQQERRNKAESEKRLAESAESRFPRPAGTNWLRVISDEQAHLVLFASRDWKVLSRERSIPTGGEWLRLFGFDGPPPGQGGSVAEGLIVGYEVTGDVEAMVKASRQLLKEVQVYIPPRPDPTWCSFSVRPKPKPRKPASLAWPTALPPLIDFLASLNVSTVTIFNHHR
jgi:hypothetical protein